jgi:hypothetical protein
MLQAMLTTIFVLWVAGCVIVGAVFIRRAPAVTLALNASVLGALLAFAVINAGTARGVPFGCAMGATLGLVIGGLLGLLIAPGRSPRRFLRRAAVVVLIVAPFAGAALTLLLQRACPLYMAGRRSGYCNYGDTDVLGGWVTGVVALFIIDAVVVAGLLLVSALDVGHRRVDPETDEGRLAHPAGAVTRDPRF